MVFKGSFISVKIRLSNNNVGLNYTTFYVTTIHSKESNGSKHEYLRSQKTTLYSSYKI